MNELYVFLDESGNFVFSPTGTKYLVFTAVVTKNPFEMTNELDISKHNLILNGEGVEYFHATEDRQNVRDGVFDTLSKPWDFRIDSVIVQKNKVNPALYEYRIYTKVYEVLLKYIFEGFKGNFSEVVIFTDLIPLKQKIRNIEKGLKESIKWILGEQKQFFILHHSAKSHFYLQCVDYCSWAIYKKWTDNELRPYEKIKDKIKSEFDIFQRGTTYFY